MKKALVFSMGLALVAPMTVLAVGGNHPRAGCGLGYVLFGHDDNSTVMQVLAATTNGTSGNQTFGMTSGTSGCTEDGAVKFVKEVEVFAEVNLDSLRVEMAKGQGEFVNSFAYLLGANDTQVPSLVETFKTNYETLFPNSTTTSAEMLTALGKILSGNGQLS